MLAVYLHHARGRPAVSVPAIGSSTAIEESFGANAVLAIMPFVA